MSQNTEPKERLAPYSAYTADEGIDHYRGAPSRRIAALGPPTKARDARAEMSQILGSPPPVGEDLMDGRSHITPTWTHGAVDSAFLPMHEHVLINHYGASQFIGLYVCGRRYEGRARTGSFSLIPAGIGGHLEIPRPIRVSHIYIANDLLGSRESDDHSVAALMPRAGFEDSAVTRLVQILIEHGTSQDHSTKPFLEQTFRLLLARLRMTLFYTASAIAPPQHRGLAPWQVRRVTEYMREHIEETIQLGTLAGLIGLSRHHFCTSFRQATGQTPHEWLVAERLEQSQVLLLDSTLPITAIALSVGYQTPSSFSAAFKNHTGMSPSTFRQRAVRATAGLPE